MKKFFSVFMIITSLLLSMQCRVYASDNTTPIVQKYQEWKDKLDSYPDPTNWVEELVNTTGVIVDTSVFLRDVPIAIIKQYFGLDENASTDDVKVYIDQNISEGEDGYLKVTDSFKNNVINIANYFTDYQRCYVHSYSLQDVSNRFPSVLAYNEWIKFMNENYSAPGQYLFCYISNINYIGVWDLSSVPYLIAVGKGTISNPISVAIYNGEIKSFPNFAKRYKFNGTLWVEDGNQYNAANPTYCLLDYNSVSNVSGAYQYVFSKNRVGIRFFESLSDVSVSSILTQPYYYNNQTWNNIRTSTGDYTFSPDNSNTISYNDALNYINSFNTENGYPPTVPDINIHIENKDDENKQPSGGGGSGGDDSGGSGIGDIGDIFGWLKALGSVIASLIKGVGEFVTEIMGGIVEAINTLLDGLSNIITTVTEAIPSVFMQFIQACFDWMPDEWISLLTASLLLMVLWGIIKLIRGS